MPEDEKSVNRLKELVRRLSDGCVSALTVDLRQGKTEFLRAPEEDAGLFGLSAQAALNAFLEGEIDPDDREGLRAQLRDSSLLERLSAGETLCFRARRIAAKGGHPSEWRAELLSTDNHILLIRERDLGIEIEHERALSLAEDEKRANAAKSRFLANVSHEIRTPLNAILGYAELLETGGRLNPECETDVHNIVSAGGTLLEIVNNILDLSKVESGQFTVKEDPYELRRLIDELKSSILPRLQAKPVVFTVFTAPSVPKWLYGDSVLVKQVAMNLLTNAAKYTQKGSIDLGVEYENGMLQFTVRDTGIGMRPDDLKKIFERFERIENEAHSIEGTGLGLPLTRELVSQLGGEISVKSQFGKGSEFVVKLPQKIAEAQNQSEQNQGAFVAPGARVLIVDDNSVNLSVLERLLMRFEVQTVSALSGYEAINRVREHKFDLVLLDHMMPDMDGIETLKRLRALPADGINDYTALPIVALTANAMKGMREFFIEKGFNDYVSKPVSLNTLAATLRRWLKPEQLHPVEAQAQPSDDVPELLRGMDGINLATGCEFTGGYDNLISAMKNFVAVIAMKADKIQALMDEEDWKNYTIEVHGLKSSARMIGADELSQQAAYLEQCGRETRRDEILRRTPEMLKLYRSYLDKLEALTHDHVVKREVDPAKLIDELAQLIEALDDFDLDAADSWSEKAAHYRLSEKADHALQALLSAIQLIHYQEAIDCAEALQKILREEA